MKKNKLILEDKFSTLQKTMIFLFSSPLVLFFLILTIGVFDHSILGFIIAIILMALSVFILILPFAKKGFLINSNELFLGSFIGKKCFRKKKITITNTPVISILEFKTGQKMWSSVANPNLKIENYIHQINLLNEKHTTRNKIMFLEKKENAEKTLKFLTENLNLRNEEYSPNHY